MHGKYAGTDKKPTRNRGWLFNNEGSFYGFFEKILKLDIYFIETRLLKLTKSEIDRAQIRLEGEGIFAGIFGSFA
jgi:hypothetical protein